MKNTQKETCTICGREDYISNHMNWGGSEKKYQHWVCEESTSSSTYVITPKGLKPRTGKLKNPEYVKKVLEDFLRKKGEIL